MNLIHNMNMIQNNSLPAPDRLSRKREQKSMAVLDAAADLVLEAGLDGLTMQKLAARLDLAVGALYRYFPSKEALLAQLQIRALGDYDRWYQQAIAALSAAELAPGVAELAYLALCAQLYAQSAKSAPSHFALVSEATALRRELLGPADGRQVLAAALPLLLRFGGWFSHAAQHQALIPGEASQRAILYFTSIQGLLQAQKLGRFSPGLIDSGLLPLLLKTLFSGWGASPVVAEAALAAVMEFQATEAWTNLCQELWA